MDYQSTLHEALKRKLLEVEGVPLSIEYVKATELMEAVEYEKPHREKLERYIV